MPHVRKLDDLEAVAEHGLAQAARLHVDVVLGRGQEQLPAVILSGSLWVTEHIIYLVYRDGQKRGLSKSLSLKARAVSSARW